MASFLDAILPALVGASRPFADQATARFVEELRRASSEREFEQRRTLEGDRARRQIELLIAQLGGQGSTLGDLSSIVRSTQEAEAGAAAQERSRSLVAQIMAAVGEGIPGGGAAARGAANLSESGDIDTLLRIFAEVQAGRGEQEAATRERGLAREEAERERKAALEERRVGLGERGLDLEERGLGLREQELNARLSGAVGDEAAFTRSQAGSLVINAGQEAAARRLQELINGELLTQEADKPVAGLLGRITGEKRGEGADISIALSLPENDARKTASYAKWLREKPEWAPIIEQARMEGMLAEQQRIKEFGQGQTAGAIQLAEEDEAIVVPPALLTLTQRFANPAAAEQQVQQLLREGVSEEEILAMLKEAIGGGAAVQ